MNIHFLRVNFRQRRSVWFFPAAMLAFVMLLLGPLGTRFGVFDYQLGLLMLALAFVLSAVILLVELVILLRKFFSRASTKLGFDLLPIFLMFLTSVISGSKIRTMWMTPFYLFMGTLLIYIFQNQETYPSTVARE